MFTPFDLRGLTLPNRVVMAPMAQYSAIEGDLTPWHFSHYTARALGGAGLIFTEMTCPTPDARITTACTGLWSDAQQADWTRLVDFIHAATPAKVALQLGHAGRKGSTNVPELGENLPMAEGNWPVWSASPLPYFDNASPVPIELDRAAMHDIRDSFVAATVRGVRAGFDMLELHAAHAGRNHAAQCPGVAPLVRGHAAALEQAAIPVRILADVPRQGADLGQYRPSRSGFPPSCGG
jgi:anthraniloyl-CoA monooxygenase